MRRRDLIPLLLVLAACGPQRDPAAARADQAAITNLMRQTWERPDAPLDVGPVVVAGRSAVADWTQGPIGGRALLERRDTGWRVVLCAGDGIRTESGLIAAGLPADEARDLARDLARAEAATPPARLTAMSAFKGVVQMSEAGH